jgi:hypothetical protein
MIGEMESDPAPAVTPSPPVEPQGTRSLRASGKISCLAGCGHLTAWCFFCSSGDEHEGGAVELAADPASPGTLSSPAATVPPLQLQQTDGMLPCFDTVVVSSSCWPVASRIKLASISRLGKISR